VLSVFFGSLLRLAQYEMIFGPKDVSALPNAEATVSENQFGVGI